MKLTVRPGPANSLTDEAGLVLQVRPDFDVVIRREIIPALRQLTGINEVVIEGSRAAAGAVGESWLANALCALSFTHWSARYTLAAAPPAGDPGTAPAPIDVTSWVEQLRIDFHRREPKVRELPPEDQAAFKQRINARYIETLRNNRFLIRDREKKQRDVASLFARVGLVDDLSMRVPQLSGNPDWVYAMDPTGRIVETRDIRLAIANDLAAMPDCESFLEVGSGSGFAALYLRALGKQVAGVELSDYRVAGARLLSSLHGLDVDFTVGNLAGLEQRDDQFDVVYSVFVLEQCKEILETAIRECLRVARKYCVFVEPSLEHYTTLPSFVHISDAGQPANFDDTIERIGASYRVRRPPLCHYYNSAAVYVVDARA